MHTGEVVVTYLDERNDRWRLTGDTMNVAARLQSVAEPGTVLVGAPTALAAETMFVLEPAGTPALKGIPSRSPRGGSSARARSPAARPHSTCPSCRPSAGTSSWPVWRPGWPGASWLVIAPPGAGKSRLVEELAVRARAAGHQVWTARAGIGYGAVAQLLRAALGPGATGELVLDRLARGGTVGLRDEVAVRHVLPLLAEEPLTDPRADLFSSWLTVLEA